MDKEATVAQVGSLPKPTTEAAPGPAKYVTDEGAVNARPRLSSQILSLHPVRGQWLHVCGHDEHRTIVEQRGRSFQERYDMGGAYVECVGEVKSRHVLGADWRDMRASR